MKRVIILGGGFAGIETALRLKNYKDDIEILVIHEQDTFTFVPALYETAAGELDEGQVSILLSRLMNKKGIIFYHDKVKNIDLKKKALTTERIKTIRFDVLVFAIGAQTNYYNVSGAEQYTHDLKTKDDAQLIYEYVTNTMSQKRKHDFVICGGGLTGVEFAASLQEHITRECKNRKINPSKYSVTILEAAPSIVPNLPKKAITAGTKYLEKLGVKIKAGHRIKKIGKTVIYTDQENVHYDMAVWCGGLKTHDLIVKTKLPRSDKSGGRALPGGGLLVNSYLQAPKYPFVFGCGDCICPENPQLPVIKTAQNAVDQSRYAAASIHAFLNKKPLKAYKQSKNKFYCSLGKNMGVHVDDQMVIASKAMKVKKDKLEMAYVKTIEQGKLPKNIYG